MGRKPRFSAGDAPFEAGAKVEVRCDDEGFRGAWYEATVIRLLHRRRRSYSVVYDSLVVDDDDPSRHLSEVVPGCHVRPRPPRLGAGAQYALHQLVDAYHNDGWWNGVVAAAAPAEGGGPPEKYTVAFHSSREVFEFGTSDVRQHVQWLRGQWIIPDEQAGAGAKYETGAEVEISCDRENYGVFWLLGVIEKAITKRIFLVEYKKLKEDGGSEVVKEILDDQYIRPKPPTGGAKHLAPLTEVEVFYHGGWSAGVLLKNLEDSKCIVKLKYSEEEIESCLSELRPQREWIASRWQCVSKEKRYRRSSGTGRRPSHPVSISESSSSDVDNEATCESRWDEIRCDEIGLKRKKEGSNCERQTELLKPFTLLKKRGPPDELWKDLGARTPSLGKEIAARPRMNAEKRIKKLAIRSPLCLGGPPYIDVQQHAKEILKRKRGRPPKRKSIADWLPPTEGMDLQQSEGTTGPIVECEQRREDLDACKQGVSSATLNGSNLLQLHDEVMERKTSKLTAHIDADNGVICSLSNDLSATTLQRKSLGQENTLIESSAATHLPNVVSGSANTVGEQMSNGNYGIVGEGIKTQDKALLPLFNEGGEFMTSSSFGTRVQENSCCDGGLNAGGTEFEDQVLVSSPSKEIAVSCDDPTSSPLQSRIIGNEEGAVVGISHPQLQPVKTMLPFAKRSCLWESFGSMEIFRVMPQQPHFCQLDKYYVEHREGMAIGLMVTFANLAASVRELQISDAEITFKETLRALVPLEKNGFNVQSLCSCVEELLKVRSRQWQSKGKKAMLEGQILETACESNKLSESTVRFDKSIMELEQRLARLRAERDASVLQREAKELEIIRLQKDVQILEEDCMSAEQHFGTLIASLWQHETTL